MKDGFRIVPSEQAGYSPGQHVVQKYYPDIGRWFDVGDPLTYEQAVIRLVSEREEARDAEGS